MAKTGAFTHGTALSWAGGRAAAQNIGLVSGCKDDDIIGIMRDFVESPPHLTNLLGPAYKSVGVGVALPGSCDQAYITVNLLAGPNR